jgi:hypothetical protein
VEYFELAGNRLRLTVREEGSRNKLKAGNLHICKDPQELHLRLLASVSAS